MTSGYDPEDSSKTPTDDEMLREDWQRGVATAIFGRLSDHLFFTINAAVPDAAIEQALRDTQVHMLLGQESGGDQSSRQHNYNTLAATERLLALLVPDGRALAQFLRDNVADRAAIRRIDEQSGAGAFTFYHVTSRIMLEVLRTVIYFPLNVLGAVSWQSPESDQLPLGSLAEVAATLQAPWFRRLMATAASVNNGAYNLFSTDPGYDFSISRRNARPTKDRKKAADRESSMQLFGPFAVRQAQIEFPNAAPRITAVRVAHNRAVRSGDPDLPDMSAKGTSSGCVGNRLRPIFKSDDEVARVAQILGIDESEIRAGWAETPIDSALTVVAQILVRAATIQSDESR